MQDTLFNLIQKGKYSISIYTEEIFERRCQEEIIRSDEDNSSFVYIELDFEHVKKCVDGEENALKFWSIFLASLNKSNRGSDIIASWKIRRASACSCWIPRLKAGNGSRAAFSRWQKPKGTKRRGTF